MRFISVREFRGKSGDVWKELAEEQEFVITSNGKPIAIVGPVTPPKRLSGERPRLEPTEGAPPRRRLAVSFVIRSNGTVSEAKIIGNIPPGMHAGVIATLSSWVFEPARLPDGTAVTAFWLQGVSLSPE